MTLLPHRPHRPHQLSCAPGAQLRTPQSKLAYFQSAASHAIVEQGYTSTLCRVTVKAQGEQPREPEASCPQAASRGSGSRRGGGS